MTKHQAQWNQLQSARNVGRLSQSLLFVGPLHCFLADFTKDFIPLLVCNQNGQQACHECNDCQMAIRSEHPDVEWLRPDKVGGPIKIDQIRDLQKNAYLTPQRAAQRVIVIDGADRMNTASANALLKILEEPAKHTQFILIAQQLSTVIPTVLSRCQIMRFATTEALCATNLLNIADYYPQDSMQAKLVNASESIIDGLIAIIEKREHPCALAALWSEYEINALLWFLYLILAQVQGMQFVSEDLSGRGAFQLRNLASLVNPVLLFMQMDKINALLKKLSHNIPIHSTLALEDFLYALQG